MAISGGRNPTVLSNINIHDTFLSSLFLEPWEEVLFFTIVMGFQSLITGVAVRDKGFKVGGLDSSCLVIDAIESSNDTIVNEGHF